MTGHQTDGSLPGAISPLLVEALTNAQSDPHTQPATPPLAFLAQSTKRVDERMITLLTILGERAVADDPGLVLRLGRGVEHLPTLTPVQRQVLGLRLFPLEAGPSQGSGTGLDYSGLAPHGPFSSLLPAQLTIDWELTLWRLATRQLLYRERSGRAPPRLRPVVLILDVSPPVFGPVEGITRPAAYAIVQNLQQAGLPVALVTAGGTITQQELIHSVQLLQLFTARSSRLPSLETVMTTAHNLSQNLADQHHPEPILLLLTHPWWGAEEEHIQPIPRLRGLFVQYPGQEIRPAWADYCERWESLPSTGHARLEQALGKLIG